MINLFWSSFPVSNPAFFFIIFKIWNAVQSKTHLFPSSTIILFEQLCQPYNIVLVLTVGGPTSPLTKCQEEKPQLICFWNFLVNIHGAWLTGEAHRRFYPILPVLIKSLSSRSNIFLEIITGSVNSSLLLNNKIIRTNILSLASMFFFLVDPPVLPI